MPGRMESVENLLEAAVPGSMSGGWFSTLPTAPWKSLRDSHSSTAPTTTMLSHHQGDTSTGLPQGTFLLGLDIMPRIGWMGTLSPDKIEGESKPQDPNISLGRRVKRFSS